MWALCYSLLLITCVHSRDVRNGAESFTIYQTPENIMSNGYPAEMHQVTTEDGYILEMHRIPKGRDQDASRDRPVVFLMHGLMSASSGFIGLGPNKAMAYNLADAGFDVWMGNARGTRNSRNHISLNPDGFIDKFRFFNFSFEEIGMIDVAAMVDYALNATGKKTLHYIGHSQGGTVFLVLNSMRPEYNDKFKSAHLLAGVGYQDYFPNEQLINLSVFTDQIYSMALLIGLVEIYMENFNEMPQNTNTTRSVADLCDGVPEYKAVCITELTKIMTRDDNGIGIGSPSFHVGGAALKQFAHYGQNIRDKIFRRWNFGTRQNQQIYGADTPPIYNLTLITTNVTMHYTLSDVLLDERDVLAMAKDMPNTIVRKVLRETFLHEDFIAAEDSRELVTDYIIEAIWATENHLEREGYPDSSSSIYLSTLLKTCLLLYSLKILNIIYF